MVTWLSKCCFFPCCQCCHWSLSMVSKFIYVIISYIYTYICILYTNMTNDYTPVLCIYNSFLIEVVIIDISEASTGTGNVVEIVADRMLQVFCRCLLKQLPFKKSKSDHFPAKFPAKCIILFIFFGSFGW